MKVHPPQLDLFASREERDAGMDQVTQNAGAMFIQKGLYVIHDMTGELTGEDIRVACHKAGVVPHHHNAWGALVRTAIKLRLIRDTGRSRQASNIAAHARRIAVYVRNKT